MNLSDLPLIYEDAVAENHLDFNGHVNVMWYTYFFDQAVRKMFESFGLFGDNFTQTGNSMFALEQHTRYLGELRLHDQIEIYVRILSRDKKRIHFILFLQNLRNERLSATGELIGMHVNLSSRSSVVFPQEASDMIDAMLNAHQALDWDAPVCDKMELVQSK